MTMIDEYEDAALRLWLKGAIVQREKLSAVTGRIQLHSSEMGGMVARS